MKQDENKVFRIVHNESITRNFLEGWDSKMCRNIYYGATQPRIIFRIKVQNNLWVQTKDITFFIDHDKQTERCNASKLYIINLFIILIHAVCQSM